MYAAVIIFSDSLTEHSLRLIPLQHSKVASFVRDQNLSNVWTVEYALELLFIGGLIPEAVWLAHKLGDWKTAVSIGVAFQVFCKRGRNFVRYEFGGQVSGVISLLLPCVFQGLKSGRQAWQQVLLPAKLSHQPKV